MRFLIACLLLAGALAGQGLPTFTRTEDVVYGRKFGLSQTMDVFRPAQANGHGVVLTVSASFLSNKNMIRPVLFQELLKRGYTVFAVLPSSGPRFFLTEMAADMHRAVRFIRANAGKFQVDPDKLGDYRIFGRVPFVVDGGHAKRCGGAR